MGTRSDNLPNGLYRDDDGSIGLIICPKCQRENYALNVALGYCTWCGYDANKDYNIQQPEEGVGAFRYYCSPEGLITEVDLPDKWGLLWEKDGVITVVKDAERQQQNAQGEITILASIMRREGVKPRLFDYRKQNNEYEAERRN